MRNLSAAALLALGLASTNASGNATARVVVNGETLIDMSSTTGMKFTIDNQMAFLSPGQSLDLRYTWSVQVQDDGLPAGLLQGSPTAPGGPNACVPLNVRVCGLEPSGFEQARAVLNFAYLDLRGEPFPPNAFTITTRGDAIIDLTTNTGPAGDSFVRSGEFFLHIENNPNSFFSGRFPFSTWAAGWTYASSIPEPPSWAHMLAGLLSVGCAFRIRRSLAQANKPSSQ